MPSKHLITTTLTPNQVADILVSTETARVAAAENLAVAPPRRRKFWRGVIATAARAEAAVDGLLAPDPGPGTHA